MQVKKIAQLSGHNSAIFALVAGAGQRHVLTGAGDGWVVQWDVGAPDMGRLLAKVERQVFSLCFLEKQGKIVAGNMDGGLHWIDLEQPGLTKNLTHHQRGVFEVLAVGGHVFTAGGEGKLSRWSVAEMRATESYYLANQALRCMDFSAPRNELAVGSSDGAIYFLDATTLEIRHTIRPAHGSSVFSVRYSPDGQHLLSGGRDAHLNAWDLTDNFRLISSQPAHWFTINSICFSPNGRHFATASRDKTLNIWDAKNLELLKVLEGGRDGGHFNSVNRVLWLNHGNLLLSCSDDRTVIIWEATP
jgi:WD40 repeat protein